MLQTAIIAFSLSTDAFAASIAKGARFPGLTLWRSTWIALGFGVLEATAPLIGYLLGMQFADVIDDYDHWIAFTLLGLPNQEAERTDYAVKIPYVLGLIATRSLDEPITGIIDLKQ